MIQMPRRSYNRSVFINCPFDNEYLPVFHAIVFTVLRCNFHARCALEEDDSSELRLSKIFRMITECRLGIHDISRTQLDRHTHLPRFNMPFELGIFLAAKHFDPRGQGQKICIVFERKRHTYEKFLSDIKGQDIKTHDDSPREVTILVRNWLATNTPKKQLPGGQAIYKDYQCFRRWMPKYCKCEKLNTRSLTYCDFVNIVYAWFEGAEK
jgi:hypothetical protein